MWLLVGLGNPGEAYTHTRHNVGFLAIDALATSLGVAHFQVGFSAEYTKKAYKDLSLVLIKPQTFMNRSGAAVQSAAAFYKITPDRILVIHDDLDLPFGILRLKQGGGHGGHNGLKDIIRVLGPNFLRLRLGIGRPERKGQEANFVLENYNKAEQALLGKQLEETTQVILMLLTEGLAKTQLQLHTPQASK